MSDRYLPLIVEATTSVFEMMLGTTLSPLKPLAADADRPDHEISGIIGLSGQGKGMVSLSLTREAALSATGAMLGTQPTDIDPSVVDTVGELTNMVAGMLKSRLEQLNLNMGLPTVVTGKSHCIVFPSDVVPVCLPFDCPWGRVIVEFGMLEPSRQPKRAPHERHEVV
jgi:chemotaxis protein CheX